MVRIEWQGFYKEGGISSMIYKITNKKEVKSYISSVIWVVIVSAGIVFWITKVAP